MDSLITVTIRGWGKKYNKRPDIKHPHWFALSNKILQDPEMHILNSREFAAWIYILCLASDKKSGVVTIIWAHVENHKHWFSSDELVSTIKKLGTLKILEAHFQDTYEIRTGSVRDPEQSGHQTETKTKKETKTERPAAENSVKVFENSFDHESLGKIQIYLDQVFQNKVPPDLVNAKARLLTAYGSPENFKACLEDIINMDGADPEKNKAKWRGYISVAIKKQAGLIQDAS